MRPGFRPEGEPQLVVTGQTWLAEAAAGSSAVVANSLIEVADHKFVKEVEHSPIAKAYRVAAEHNQMVAHKPVAGVDHNQEVEVDHNQAA